MTQPNRYQKPRLAAPLAAILAIGALCAGKLPAQTPIPATHVLPLSAADTNQPGFIWNVSQVTTLNPGTVAWSEAQLAGQEGANLADPTAIGAASAPASPPNPATAPISFVITDVINLNISGGSSAPDHSAFPNQGQMPGLPGLDGTAGNGTDNTVAECLTYLYLPAGVTIMGVNHDDGFSVKIGGATPGDEFAPIVGVFDGTTGHADTIFQIQVPQAGLYAARCLYFNSGGAGEVEWFTLPDGSTNAVLVNDLANGGVPAYRAVQTSYAYFKTVDPAPGVTDVSPAEGIHLALVDGSSPIATTNISLALDGVTVNPSINKTGAVTTIVYDLPAVWSSLSTHTGAVAYLDGTTRNTNTWSWTVQYYTSLASGWRQTSVDTTKAGFNWNIFANGDPSNGGTVNGAPMGNERAELDLTLQATDPLGNGLVNNADPNAINGAAGPAPAPNPANAPIHFEVPGTINFDTAVTTMPGAPSTDGTSSGQAAEVLTYLSLPAGTIAMEVDATTGWRLYSGAQPTDVFNRAVLAENNSRSGITKFSFVVPQAGIYPFRLLWQNGTGAPHLKWYSLDSSGNAVLVNDVAHGGIPAYRSLLTGTNVPPAVVSATPLIGYHQQKLANTNLLLVLQDGTHPVNDASVTLAVDGKPVPTANLTKQRQGNYLTVSEGGTAFPGLQLQGDMHLGVLTFSDSTGTYSSTQQWNFVNIQILQNVPANPITGENFDSYPEATSSANTVPPGWSAWNFTAVNIPGWNLQDKSSDSYKDWILINNTTMTSSGVESGAATYDLNQTINNQPVTNFYAGNVLWATSDGRSGPQVQFCISSPFNLSTVTNPVMLFSSILRMSAEANAQADGIEYSIDGGTTWYPGIVYVSVAHSRLDYVMLAPNGDINVTRTLNPPFIAAQNLFGTWTDPGPGPFTGQVRGNTYASGLAEPATQSLAPLLAIRDDDQGSAVARADLPGMRREA